ncbi:MAG: cell division protein ZapA [Firmicutes bacterium]|jgi:cell division protein ZapA|nr:cell division protein ZapA [Bacillota bacterium]
MAEQMTRTTVTIFGEEYRLRSDLPEETVRALAHHVDSVMRVLSAKGMGTLNPTRLAVLTALNLAEDLFRVRAEYEELVAAMQHRWRSKREVKQANEG